MSFLQSVWVNYGFVASNAGLNNYISELRKAFIALEMNREVIKTIPKLGFRMSADIQSVVKTERKESSENGIVERIYEDNRKEPAPLSPGLKDLQIAPEKPVVTQQEQIDSIPPRRGRRALEFKAVMFALPLVLALLVLFFLFTTKANNQAQKNLLYQEGLCKVFTLGADKGTEEMVIRAKKQISDIDINCQRDKHDLFYVEQHPDSNVINRVFIAVCNPVGSDEYSSCTNYKYNQVVIK
ncbi:hypothetical protein BHU62_21910 [Serratia marcescens]|uniref:OmpR/PhoB-type domain-containing protein n=1 Tax=Serratia marcescens TaxID=615 RepID=A0A1Q4NUM2_SERMA|nr:hypothetical protein [Serratia marcescens]OKB64585.1 hypothetical protein BHU62_21910 [Serratia marcescens]